jgi:flavorubredoxin
MGIVNARTGTRIDEVAEGIYRISTPVPPAAMPGGFTFNQFLVDDDEPLLFHTGPRRVFALVCEAMKTVMPPEKLRWVAFSHWEPDETGALNEWLEIAPQATAVHGHVGVNVCVTDQAIRPPHALGDGATLSIGTKQMQWIDTPHLPHGWDCGFMFEAKTHTLLAGDLFTQGGHDVVPVTERDILGPSEAFRASMDYYSHTKNGKQLIEKLACCEPTTLACMHGSSWRGNGAKLLRELGNQLST